MTTTKEMNDFTKLLKLISQKLPPLRIGQLLATINELSVSNGLLKLYEIENDELLDLIQDFCKGLPGTVDPNGDPLSATLEVV